MQYISNNLQGLLGGEKYLFLPQSGEITGGEGETEEGEPVVPLTLIHEKSVD